MQTTSPAQSTSARTIPVPSRTQSGVVYNVSANHCDCAGFFYRQSCAHIDMYFPKAKTKPAPKDTSRFDEAMAQLTASWATCCACGQKYSFDDSRPLYCSPACEAAASRKVAA